MRVRGLTAAAIIMALSCVLFEAGLLEQAHCVGLGELLGSRRLGAVTVQVLRQTCSCHRRSVEKGPAAAKDSATGTRLSRCHPCVLRRFPWSLSEPVEEAQGVSVSIPGRCDSASSAAA